jgi:hypothetical protein
MIRTLNYIVVRIKVPIFDMPATLFASIMETVDLLIFEYKGAHYGVPHQEIETFRAMGFDTAARVRYCPRRIGGGKTITFNMARLPLIHPILMDAFVSLAKPAYDFEKFWKGEAKPNPDPKKNPDTLVK